jgi:hypothetical protein
MDPGKIDGDLYRNAQIGVTYEFPQGWNIEPQGGVEPSVERYREKVIGEPMLGPRERAVVKACRRTLLSVWRTKPDTGSQVAYEDFGEVTLTAMPLSCFPNIRFPDDAKDAVAVRQFVAGLSFTQPLQRDMTEARTFEASGKSFVMTHGTIAYKVEGDALSRRISVSMAMTQQRGYLLIWLFAAPHDAELRELMAAKMSFDADARPQEPNASIGPTAVASPKSQAEAATAGAAPAVAPPVRPAANPVSDTPASQASMRPTLVRPGEDAQGQAVAGRGETPKQPN